MYATLLQSDTVQSYGHSKTDTRPVGVGLRKKPMDLSASEREKIGHGEVGMCILLCFSQIQYSHMVTQKQTRDLGGLYVKVHYERMWYIHERQPAAKTPHLTCYV